MQINLLYTLIVSLLVFFMGRTLVTHVGLLQRFSVPAPVVGGVIVAVVLALLDGVASYRISFDMSLKDSLLLAFFTTVGLGADARMLVKGGPKLAVFLAASIAFIAVQNTIGVVMARALDLHPTVGLLAGSVTLIGGHGTGAAYGTRFGETMNLQGSMELAMACATAGLVLGSLLGGPIAAYLINRYQLHGSAPAVAEPAHAKSAEPEDLVGSQSFLTMLFILFACLAGGRELARLMQNTGLILPDFLFCLLLGVAVRNFASLTGLFRMSDKTIELLGNVSLSLFLVMALIAMKLLDLVNLAGPLLLILGLQTVAMAAYAIFVTFRIMGRDYDAAVIAAGQVGFAMSSTAAALAIMKAVTDRSGPSPVAFLIVPMVGAFFIDIANAVVIQLYLALPWFGF
ncbi:MAG: sodium/glutamate symporter [Myxococcota bacterium]